MPGLFVIQVVFVVLEIKCSSYSLCYVSIFLFSVAQLECKPDNIIANMLGVTNRKKIAWMHVLVTKNKSLLYLTSDYNFFMVNYFFTA